MLDEEVEGITAIEAIDTLISNDARCLAVVVNLLSLGAATRLDELG